MKSVKEIMQVDMNGKVSAAAKRAREKYEAVHGEGMLGYAAENWRKSVRPFFNEFLKALRDEKNPVPGEYFEVGMGFSDNPIFAFPTSKAIHCIMFDIGGMSPSDRGKLMRDVVEPYVAKWEELLAALELRFGRQSGLVAFRGKLSALYDKVFTLQYETVPRSGFLQDYNSAPI